MTDRRVVRVDEIADTIAMGPFGSNIKVETFQPAGIPIISGGHLHEVRLTDGEFNYISVEHADRLGRSNVGRGDVVFTHAGNIGQVSYIPQSSKYDRYVISQRQFYLRCNELACPRYIAYYFRSPLGKHDLLANASQVGVPSIARPASYLRSIKINLPSIGEQCAIADVLTLLDDKIEMNRRMNETLEAMAQAIFRDWFVDFGPTRRKIDGASDPVEIMGGLVSDPDRARELAELFPAVLGDDGLPEGWTEGDLGQYALLNSESWTARKAPQEVDYVDLANTKWGTIETTTAYRWPDAPSRARRVVRKGDTIVGTVRPGNGSYAYIGVDGLTASTGFAVLRPQRPETATLTYLAATSQENIERLQHLADGGAYPAIRPDVVLSTSLPIIPSVVVSCFSMLCDPLISRIEHGKRENRTLSVTRDLLLPKLMSGEIRLDEAREEMEAAQ